MTEDQDLDLPLLSRLPERMGAYRLDRRLGQGASGVVFAATLLEPRPFGGAGMQVAVKVLHPALQRDRGALARFLREGAAGSRITHQAVVKTYDADTATVDRLAVSFLVQELVEGMSLGALLAEMTTVPEALLRSIGGEVARALEAIHAAGVVHRDLKPSNVLVTRDQRAKIADLGLVSLAGDTSALTASGIFLGTPLYASPEQIEGHGVGPATDLYSLGVVLYECATGLQPFAAEGVQAVMMRHLRHAPPLASELNPTLSQFLAHVLRDLLAKSPADRFQSAAEVAATLEQGEESSWWRGRSPAPIARLRSMETSEVDAAVGTSELRSRSRRPVGNLARNLTSFVGREQELLLLAGLVARSPLVTLTGAGGCGKTRLGLRLAAELEQGYADGAWLVELGALTDQRLVAGALAAALGVREVPGQAIEELLARYLAGREMLIVIDNCEHLLDATAALVETWLSTSSRLRVVATSREPLGVPGEVVFVVLSLGAADAESLFLERARSAVPGYDPAASDARLIPEICRRLDGMPLAIELAAARVRALSVAQIAQRLDHRFRLLTGGSRTASPRQRSLKATMDWSWEHLSATEQTLLGRLAVFAGGFTLEAVEEVCGGPGLERQDVLDLLTRLVDKSLVTTQPRGEVTRYGLLETVREYGREHLERTGEARAVRDRHLDWFMALANEGRSALSEGEPGGWLERLEREHDNLRAALAWSQSSATGAEKGLELGAALVQFWTRRGHVSEGREWLATALSHPGAQARTHLRAEALTAAMQLVARQFGHSEARSRAEEALSIWRELGDRTGIARSLNMFGILARQEGDLEAARRLYQESLDIHRQVANERGLAVTMDNLGNTLIRMGDHDAARALHQDSLAIARRRGFQSLIVNALNNLSGIAAHHGDLVTARACIHEALAVARAHGDRVFIAMALNTLADILLEGGDTARARACLEESLTLQIEEGERRGMGISMHGLGYASWLEGDRLAARARYQEALGLFRELGNKQWAAHELAALAYVDACEGRLRRATRLFAAAERMREAIGFVPSPRAREEIDVGSVKARAAVGDEEFETLWADGRALTVEQATALALERDPG